MKIFFALVFCSMALRNGAATAPLPVASSNIQPECSTGRQTGQLPAARMLQPEQWSDRLFPGNTIEASYRYEEPSPKQKKQAQSSLILGIGSLVLSFVPYVNILAIPAAIAAIILGVKSRKGNRNKKGLIGLIAGSVIIMAVLIVAAVMAFDPPPL